MSLSHLMQQYEEKLTALKVRSSSASSLNPPSIPISTDFSNTGAYRKALDEWLRWFENYRDFLKGTQGENISNWIVYPIGDVHMLAERIANQLKAELTKIDDFNVRLELAAKYVPKEHIQTYLITQAIDGIDLSVDLSTSGIEGYLNYISNSIDAVGNSIDGINLS